MTNDKNILMNSKIHWLAGDIRMTARYWLAVPIPLVQHISSVARLDEEKLWIYHLRLLLFEGSVEQLLNIRHLFLLLVLVVL